MVVFLPQILLLFLFIGILEDSGYLARAALIADRTMRRAGLQGKSFIPLLSAYACAVPAILSTRTIENKRDRIATILIAPFMTCSARLPVYALLIAAFLPDTQVARADSRRGRSRLLGLYVLGFLAALFTARILKSSVLKSERNSFVLEMPPYRWPTVQSLGLRLRRSLKGVSPARRNRDSRRSDCPVVPCEFAGARWQTAGHRARALIGTDRQDRRAGDSAAGLQLEDRHRPHHFACGA